MFNVSDRRYWASLFYKTMGFYAEDPLELFKDELAKYGKLDNYKEFLDVKTMGGVKMAGRVVFWKPVTTKRKDKMAIMHIQVDYEKVPVVLWPSFFRHHQFRKLSEEDILGSFVFVFGQKQYDPQGRDQITLSYHDQEYLEVLA
jgi:DNA polymerase III alpha subunit